MCVLDVFGCVCCGLRSVACLGSAVECTLYHLDLAALLCVGVREFVTCQLFFSCLVAGLSLCELLHSRCSTRTFIDCSWLLRGLVAMNPLFLPKLVAV